MGYINKGAILSGLGRVDEVAGYLLAGSMLDPDRAPDVIRETFQ